MTYTRFFNLHIPKTGGTYFTENILYKLQNELNKNNISINEQQILLSNNIYQEATMHWCWYKPYIHNSSYIFTTLRDPSKRLISQYVWQAIRAIHSNNSDYNVADITMNNFYKWLDDNPKVYKNFQSKNLVYYNSNHDIYVKALPTIWKLNEVPKVHHFLFSEDFANYNIDNTTLYNNIKRINFIVKTEDMKSLDNQLKIQNKLIDDLKLNVFDRSLKIDGNGNKNELSNNLYDKFTSKQIEKLYEFNNIDSELYFSNIYTQY